MKENQILSRMVKDHCKIEKLLDKLKEDLDKEFEILEKSFKKYEWELEKHLFVEEKAIFTSYSPENVSEGYKMLPEIKIQHNFILNKLYNWRNDVKNKKIINDFYDFKKFLISHRKYEENEVYPKLDEELNDDQKKQIIDRINEIA
jgi:hemerythrin superfamily protein